MTKFIERDKTLLEFSNLQYLLVDALLNKFKQYGEIRGFFIQNASAQLQFKNLSDDKYQEVLLAEENSFGNGKIQMELKCVVSKEGNNTDTIQNNQKLQMDVLHDPQSPETVLRNDQMLNEQESSDKIMEPIGVNDDQMPNQNQTDSSINVTMAELENESNFEMTSETEETTGENTEGVGIKLDSNTKFFNSELLFEAAGPLSCRILIDLLNKSIKMILLQKFRQYGTIKHLNVSDCFALIQYASYKQAYTASRAKGRCNLPIGTDYRVIYLDKRGKFPSKKLYIHHNRRVGILQKKWKVREIICVNKISRLKNSECQIIVTSRNDLGYANLIISKLKNFNLTTALLFSSEASFSLVLRDITYTGALYAIIVEGRNLILFILHGECREYKILPLEDTLTCIVKNFIEFKLSKISSSTETSTQTELEIESSSDMLS